ncbi:hypothetical protein Aca07nite_87720 [Actinoplanes capillaceus]|uniref:MinD-like ATPase involved in chromosome partitioning or flagellar assembly n=1 Tax=Actinoplanes campanulatus TaxID=113559 RepID=A0ABQ3WZ63_9ACTN|nr:hypothetical protein [Actinoplanes capillaceus]GID51497.1 hypothetical protein Aca07nite_87720 [Actinoplanes capillaceus]
MLIAIGSVKHAPGATSLAVALAARSVLPDPLVVEADPAGGDLQARFGVQGEPGLSNFAADAAAGGRELDLATYARPLGETRARAVFGPADEYRAVETGAIAATRSLIGESGLVVGMVAQTGLDALRQAAERRMVLLDVGRLSWESPALTLAAGSDVLLLVTHAGIEALDSVRVRRNRLLTLPSMRASLRLVLRGELPCPAWEIAATLGLPVAATVPDDRRAAAVLTGRSRPGRGWTRTEMLRAARGLAMSLAREFQQVPAPPPGVVSPLIRAPHDHLAVEANR